MDIEKLQKNLEGRGFTFKYFETGAEAADYLAEQMTGGGHGLALEDRAERGAGQGREGAGVRLERERHRRDG